MRGYPVEYAEKPAQKHDENTAYRVLYDGQCEICQAWVSWLKALARKNKTIKSTHQRGGLTHSGLPAQDRMNAYGSYTSSRPRTRFYVGWDAVTMFGTVVPVNVAHRRTGKAVPPFAILGGCYTGSLRRTDTPSASAVGVLAALRNQKTVRRQARTRCILVVLHTWLLHSIAAGRVGGCQGRSPKNKYFLRTYHKRLDLLSGKLTILFLNGVLPNAVPLLFGELFTAVLYDGGRNRPRLAQDATSHWPSTFADCGRKSQKWSRLTPTKNTSET